LLIIIHIFFYLARRDNFPGASPYLQTPY
jgi:hypothetical protein